MLFRELHERVEGGGIADGEVGHHPAVDGGAGLREAVNEPAVRHPPLLAGRVDADYPQSAKQTFLGPAVSVSIAESLFHSLLGLFETEASGTPVTFGHLKYLLATTMGLKAPCNPWHFLSSSF